MPSPRDHASTIRRGDWIAVKPHERVLGGVLPDGSYRTASHLGYRLVKVLRVFPSANSVDVQVSRGFMRALLEHCEIDPDLNLLPRAGKTYWLTTTEAARLFYLDPSAIRHAIARGFPARKSGSTWLLDFEQAANRWGGRPYGK